MITGSPASRCRTEVSGALCCSGPTTRCGSGRERRLGRDRSDVVASGVRQADGPPHLGTARPSGRARGVDQQRPWGSQLGIGWYRRRRFQPVGPGHCAVGDDAVGRGPAVHDQRLHAGAPRRGGHLGEGRGAGDRAHHAGVGVLVGELVGPQLPGGRHGSDADGERRGMRLQRGNRVVTEHRDPVGRVGRDRQQGAGGPLEIDCDLGPGARPGVVAEGKLIGRSLRPWRESQPSQAFLRTRTTRTCVSS